MNTTTFNEAEDSDVVGLGGFTTPPARVEKEASEGVLHAPERPAPKPLSEASDSNETNTTTDQSSNGDAVAALVTPAPASPTTIPRSFIRDRLRLFGKPAASTKTDKRPSID